MSASQTNIIQIIKSNTKLWANQWICRRIKLSCYTIRLEAKNTSCNKINIISPSSNNRISFYCLAWYSSSCKRFLEALPSITVCNLFTLSSNSCSFPNKCISANAPEISNILLFITTVGNIFRFPPIIMTALASGPAEAKFLKNLCRIVFFRIGFKLWLHNFFHFLNREWCVPWLWHIWQFSPLG